MKKHLVLKTTLALGILATGGIVAQQDIQADTVVSTTVDKAEAAKKANELKSYYQKQAYDPSYVQGRKMRGKNVIEFVVDRVDYEVEVSKEVYEKYKNYDRVHLFLVKESGDNEWGASYGGVTKVNNRPETGKYFDVEVKLENKSESQTFYTGKDEISLKEVDFRLRQDLIKHHHLYKDGELNKGTIKVTTADSSYTIELDKLLSREDMYKTIDATKVQKIEVDLKNN